MIRESHFILLIAGHNIFILFVCLGILPSLGFQRARLNEWMDGGKRVEDMSH